MRLGFVLTLSFNLRLAFRISLFSSGFATKTTFVFSYFLCDLHYSCVDIITIVTPHFSRISHGCDISLLIRSNKVRYDVMKTSDLETITLSGTAANLGIQNRLCSGTEFHTPFSKGSVNNILLSLIHNDIQIIKVLITKSRLPQTYEYTHHSILLCKSLL